MKKKIFLLCCIVSFAVAGPVSYYGKLKVRAGTPFIDGVREGREDIKLVQVRGVSFGWSNTNWESARFYNANAVERMARDWKAEIVRAAYGSTSLAFSSADATANRTRIETIVDAAIENDVYVIIDWHSHNAHNEITQAKAFFAYMAEKYGESDHVIFEIYNEPLCSNGANRCSDLERTTWAQIKAYAEEIIPVIREHSDNLILVGTPEWSQRIESVIGNAINDPNVGYVLHFYAQSHPLGGWQNNINSALSNALPVFVTEYGTTHSSGGCSPLVSNCGKDPSGKDYDHYNTHNAARSDDWHEYMDSKRISSVAWNINDKYESSAFFGTIPERGGGTFDQNSLENWSDSAKMTESGKYIFKKLNEYHNSTSIRPPANQLILPGDAIYEIFSLQGKRMGSDVSNLKNGVYILFLRQNGSMQRKTLRIVK